MFVEMKTLGEIDLALGNIKENLGKYFTPENEMSKSWKKFQRRAFLKQGTIQSDLNYYSAKYPSLDGL